jgi:hypothetical protein
MLEPLAVRRAPMLTLAVLLFLAKCLQFAIDSTALFCSDSGAFVLNGLNLAFLPQRSYAYGYLLRIFAMPFHSLRAIVAMQLVMGGITAWLLGFVLVRYFKVRPGFAILAALALAFDPAEMVDEHMVMAETAAMLAMGWFLLLACRYLQEPRLWRLAWIAFAGIVLVSMRIVYLPPVLVVGAVLPLAAYFWSPAWPRTKGVRAVSVALVVSCTLTGFAHWGYRHLTGRLGWREPAYHYATGFFLVASVAPLIRAGDTNDPRLSRAMVQTAFPLSDVTTRPRQLWVDGGFVYQIKAAFNGDMRASNDAADRLARTAIYRNPIGFLRLGIYTYLDYWRHLRKLRWALPWEIGATENSELLPYDTWVISSHFGQDVSHNSRLSTPSRRFYLLARYWLLFLLLSPFMAAAGLWIRPRDKGATLLAAFLLVWSCLVITSACLGAVEAVYRYFHPLSFTALAAAALLVEKFWRRRTQLQPSAQWHAVRTAAGDGNH